MSRRSRPAREGPRHGYDISPDPPSPGEPATVWLHADDAVAAHVYFTKDGSEPDERSEAVPMVGCGAGRWKAVIPGVAEGTRVRYRIAVVRGGRSTFVADAGPTYHYPVPGVPSVRPPSELFSYVSQDPVLPDWAPDAVLYHALVDRFAIAGGGPFPRDEEVPWLGFVGGTLRGLTERLDHVTGLGANTLLVSPIFPAEMHVCYDHKDLFEVEPRLGTLSDVRVLCSEAHRRGLRILLDLVLCYFGSRHPFAVSARDDPSSPYRSWFHHHTPDGRLFGWFESDRLVAVDHSSPEARRYLLEAARFWLDHGFDGFRLDSAHAAPFDFWTEFGMTVGAGPFTFGEAPRPPEHCLHYRGRLSGFLDFDVCAALRGFVGDGSIDASSFDRVIASRDELPSGLAAPTFFENHDMDRFTFAAGGDRRKLLLAYLLLLTLPGPPILYYGSEVGMTQRVPGDCDIVARRPMRWGGDRDMDLYARVRELVAARHAHSSLRRGDRKTLLVENPGGYAFSRGHGGDYVVVAVNASEQESTLDVPVEWSAGTELATLGDAAVARVRGGRVRIRLPAHGGLILFAG